MIALPILLIAASLNVSALEIFMTADKHANGALLPLTADLGALAITVAIASLVGIHAARLDASQRNKL
jgi:hypothetical protein